MVLDDIDYKIMRCLKRNAREKASAISEEISLSVSAVIERIRKLEAARGSLPATRRSLIKSSSATT